MASDTQEISVGSFEVFTTYFLAHMIKSSFPEESFNVYELTPGPLEEAIVAGNVDVENTPSKVRGLDGWPDHKHPRIFKHKVAMMETAMAICRQGLAVGYFPEFVVKLHNKTQKKEFQLEKISIARSYKINTNCDVFMVKRKSDLENRWHKRIAKELRCIDRI